MEIYRRSFTQVFAQGLALLVKAPAGGSLLRLSGSAQRIWELLEYPISTEQICRKLIGEFSASMEEITQGVCAFLVGLRSRGLLEVGLPAPTPEEEQRSRYLWLLKRALVNLLYLEHELRIRFFQEAPGIREKVDQTRYLRDIRYREPQRFEALTAAKQDGRTAESTPLLFPHTLVGLQRLENLERCAEQVFADGIPGDFLEAGVCQGGAAVFLRALQVAFGQPRRRLWAADSFQGLPPARAEVDLRYGMVFPESRCPILAFSQEAVRDVFLRYDLLDQQVRFLPGWFSDTLAQAPVERLAILRVDADLYQSTKEVLESLYERVSPGGFIIVDDYGSFPACRQAVDEFRTGYGVHEPLHPIDWEGIYWRKGRKNAG